MLLRLDHIVRLIRIPTNAVSCQKMDVYDWDLRAVHLDGLDLSFTPSHTASALRMERADPYSDTKVQRELRTTAIFLYNHQNLIPMFQEKVRV